MDVEQVRQAIEAVKYKPGASIELAPVPGRLFDPEAGPLKIIIRLTIVDAQDQHSIVTKTHTKELPAARHIKDRTDLLRLLRTALRDVESYESDQWLGIGDSFPYRRSGLSPGLIPT